MPLRPPQPLAPTDSQHPLLGRRSLVQAAGAWAATAGWQAAQAQAPETLHSRVVELRGDVLRNGTPLDAQDRIAAGDQLETGPGSRVVLTVGDSAFLVRENTRLAIEGDNPVTVRLLRLLSGAVASVWSRGADRQIITPTMTAGIRGTGVYAEVLPEQDFRSYFCNCYGTVDIAAGGDRTVSESTYHQSFWAEASPRKGQSLFPAPAINHTDEEMEMLAALVRQRTAWQISGMKGPKDGRGYQYKKRPGVTAFPGYE
ncbi:MULTISPECIES: FecR family protein [unclassified Simplicispira]|uniref:FecR family protein n=1 Tax=unclassified Simplicispira TaxID=2630407 RepID=UPI000D5E961B|nr:MULTISPECIES: FecR family protein [unclassified Simplicispira]PVY56493.1 FecR family protein [Simplicispira sp. 125]REG17438.1 FecR family protein [Simplicispira sp. 110]